MVPNVQICLRGWINSPSIRVRDDVHFEQNAMINADSGGPFSIENLVRIGSISISRASNDRFDRKNVPTCKQDHNSG